MDDSKICINRQRGAGERVHQHLVVVVVVLLLLLLVLVLVVVVWLQKQELNVTLPGCNLERASVTAHQHLITTSRWIATPVLL